MRLSLEQSRLDPTDIDTMYVGLHELVSMLVNISTFGVWNTVLGRSIDEYATPLTKRGEGIAKILVTGHSQGGGVTEIITKLLRNETLMRTVAKSFFTLVTGNPYPFWRGAWHPCVMDLTFATAPAFFDGKDIALASAKLALTGRYKAPAQKNHDRSLSILATNVGNTSAIVLKPINKILHPIKKVIKVVKIIDKDTGKDLSQGVKDGTSVLRTFEEILNLFGPHKTSDPIAGADGLPYVPLEKRREIVVPMIRSHPIHGGQPFDPVKFINKIDQKLRNKIRNVPFIGDTVSSLPNVTSAAFIIGATGAGLPESVQIIGVAYHQYATYLQIMKNSGIFKDALLKTMKQTYEYHPYDTALDPGP